jgi:type VI protein secretion system component Hcp
MNRVAQFTPIRLRMHSSRRSLPLVVALLSIASTAQSQSARIVKPPNHAPAAAVAAPSGVTTTVTWRATATFSDGTTADMLAYEVQTAREAGSGMATGREAGTGIATGRRQYQPLLVRKRVDKATPLLMKAMSSSERLRYLKIEFDNKRTVQLENVTIARISPVAGMKDMEEVLVSFSAVSVNGTVPKTMSVDDWRR